MRINSEFLKQSAWQCWCSCKNKANSTRMAETRFSTCPRDNHQNGTEVPQIHSHLSSILSLMVSFKRGIWDNLPSAAVPSIRFTIFNAGGFMSVVYGVWLALLCDQVSNGYKSKRRQSGLFIESGSLYLAFGKCCVLVFPLYSLHLHAAGVRLELLNAHHELIRWVGCVLLSVAEAPPNPWDWLTNPLGFNWTQVKKSILFLIKNHCAKDYCNMLHLQLQHWWPKLILFCFSFFLAHSWLI